MAEHLEATWLVGPVVGRGPDSVPPEVADHLEGVYHRLTANEVPAGLLGFSKYQTGPEGSPVPAAVERIHVAAAVEQAPGAAAAARAAGAAMLHAA